MSEFRVTFGGQYRSEAYGADPHPVLGYDYAHTDGWLTVVAPDYATARDLTTRLLGSAWSFLYDLNSADAAATDWDGLYLRGELLRITHPACLSEPTEPTGIVGQYVGRLTDDALTDDPTVPRRDYVLVTVYGTGTAELAFRPQPTDTWGRPTMLEPHP